MTFGGDLVFGPSSRLFADLEGTDAGQYDSVIVENTVELRSQLNLLPATSYTPTLGERRGNGRFGIR